VINEMQPIDCCLLGIELGATMVARSFSGDKRQLTSILKACISHNGLAVIDVISPCVTFNDHEGSTKSYSYVKEHEIALHEVNFTPYYEEISIEMEEGEVQDVRMHDGSLLRLKKLGRDFDPTNKDMALNALHEAEKKGEVLTGILYVEQGRHTLQDMLNTVDEPLATLPESRVRPGPQALEMIMEELR